MKAHHDVDLREDAVRSLSKLAVLVERARVVPEDDVIDAERVCFLLARLAVRVVVVPLMRLEE